MTAKDAPRERFGEGVLNIVRQIGADCPTTRYARGDRKTADEVYAEIIERETAELARGFEYAHVYLCETYCVEPHVTPEHPHRNWCIERQELLSKWRKPTEGK